MHDWIRKAMGGILLVSLLMLSFSKPVQQFIQIPGSVTLFEGQEQSIMKANAMTVSTSSSEKVDVEESQQAISLEGKSPGTDEFVLEFAGLPVKKGQLSLRSARFFFFWKLENEYQTSQQLVANG